MSQTFYDTANLTAISLPATSEISSLRGRIFNIQKFSIHDGPGIRTLVFFKGCPLHCWWCSNPEGISNRFSMQFHEKYCSFCAKCVQSCPNGVHGIINTGEGEKKRILQREKCEFCGKCVQACPKQALKIFGTDMSIADLLKIILEDRVFYEQSGGGVTFGGGEPTMQPQFLHAILKECKKLGLHTAIETCGLIRWENFEPLLPFLDLLLMDLKLFDDKMHKHFTGSSNRAILNNIKSLLARNETENPKQKKVSLVIRIPVISGINDSSDNFFRTAEFLAACKNDNTLKYVELLPFHELGKQKYADLDLEYKLMRSDKTQITTLENAQKIFHGFGIDCIFKNRPSC